MEKCEMVEWCSHCENEITMQWNVSEMGYKAYCPVCGNILMLCSSCMEDDFNCDWNQENKTCKHNRKEGVKK